MATEESQDGPCQDKVVLKRKLTGPPRLLLGKSKSKNQGNDRSEARAKRNERLTVNNGVQINPSPSKQQNTEVEENVLPIITLHDLKTCSNTEEEDALPAVVTEHTMLGCSTQEEASGEHSNQNRKIKHSAKCSWKRIFDPAHICFRKQTEDAHQTSGVPLHFASTDKTAKSDKKIVEEDCISLSVKNKPDDTATKKKRRLIIQTWPLFKRFLISSQDHQRVKPKIRVKHKLSEHVQQSPLTFRNQVQRFFSRGRRETSLIVPQVEVDLQDPIDREADSETTSMRAGEKHKCFSSVQLDNTPQDGKEFSEQCTKKVTVSADVSMLFSEERNAEVMETPPGVPESLSTSDEQHKTPNTEVPEDRQRDVKRALDCLAGETMKTEEGLSCSSSSTLGVNNGLHVAMDALDANKVQTDDPHQIQCLENKGILEEAIDDVAMDTNEYLSDLSSIILLEDTEEAEVVSQEMDTVCKTTLENILHNGQILTNVEVEGPGMLQCSIQEGESSPMAEVDACDQDGNILVDEESFFFTKDHQDLVCTQRLLVQTARALVQAALSAAMDQLLMEQQDNTAIVHREAQECRDHA